MFTLPIAAASLVALTFAPADPQLPWKVLDGVTHKNLTLYPVVIGQGFTARSSSEAYITLDEGLKAGTVKVSEKSGAPQPLIRNTQTANRQTNRGQTVQQTAQRSGAEVNSLSITNLSGKKLVLLAGELVVGGQQDRIIQRDLIVPPSKTPMSLDVFCVEHGRWEGGKTDFGGFKGGAGGAVADPSVRGAAQGGRSQQMVWDNVAAKNSKAKVAPSTGTYQATLNSAKAKEDTKSFRDYFSAKFPKENVVGVVVSVNGKLQWADCFVDAKLFQRYWPKLQESFIIHAVTESDALVQGGPKPTTRVQWLASTSGASAFLFDRKGTSSFEGADQLYKYTTTVGKGFKVFDLTDISSEPVLLHSNKMLAP